MKYTKRILMFVVPLAVVNGSLAFVVRGNFLLWGLACFPVFIGLVALSVGTLTYLVAVWNDRQESIRGSSHVIMIGMILCSFGSTIPLGAWIHEQDVVNAKRYCEDLIPRLEEYRQQHGTYPKEISVLGSTGRLPWLLGGHVDFYSGYEHDYSFSFIDPTQLLGHHDYCSETKEWRIND